MGREMKWKINLAQVHCEKNSAIVIRLRRVKLFSETVSSGVMKPINFRVMLYVFNLSWKKFIALAPDKINILWSDWHRMCCKARKTSRNRVPIEFKLRIHEFYFYFWWSGLNEKESELTWKHIFHFRGCNPFQLNATRCYSQSGDVHFKLSTRTWYRGVTAFFYEWDCEWEKHLHEWQRLNKWSDEANLPQEGSPNHSLIHQTVHGAVNHMEIRSSPPPSCFCYLYCRHFPWSASVKFHG